MPYASWNGTAWTRVLVASGAQTIGVYGIDLDPVNGERPTIAYSRDASPYTPQIAYRTGPGAWTVDPHPQSTSSNWRVVNMKRTIGR